MKWREDETCSQWCLRACATEDKAVVKDVLRQVETIIENHRPWETSKGWYDGAHDLLLAKLRQLEDQETTE
jgi:hypothetical protein